MEKKERGTHRVTHVGTVTQTRNKDHARQAIAIFDCADVAQSILREMRSEVRSNGGEALACAGTLGGYWG